MTNDDTAACEGRTMRQHIVRALLYKIREISTDHLERPAHHKGEEEQLVCELERIAALAESGINALQDNS